MSQSTLNLNSDAHSVSLHHVINLGNESLHKGLLINAKQRHFF
jgi:hypothetical protein